MSHGIKRAAVIGAGTMGSRIAARIAGSDTPVLLLDIVPKGANERNLLASKAVEKLQESYRSIGAKKLRLIQPGNIEDDLDKLKDVDWVVECVPESLDVKQETYRRVGGHLGREAVISSNTSSIPLSELKKGLPEKLQEHLFIAHFFNPPHQLPLLELVTDQDNDPGMIRNFIRFADEMLGRNVVQARDTSGFIANRIGLFWLLCAMEEAQKEGISIEMADAVMSDAFGFPKTGIFALADLIGFNIISDVARSMRRYLPPEDAFCRLKAGLELIERHLENGETSFYQGKGASRKALDLKTGTWRKMQKPKISVGYWHEFLAQDISPSRFARSTLVRLLGYVANIAPDIADTIVQIDVAMRDGYGWELGPFEMIDRLGVSWLIERIKKQGMPSPRLLKEAERRYFSFYRVEWDGKEYLGFDGYYHHQDTHRDIWSLALKTTGIKPIMENKAAKLWDIGDGIACFEITTKMSVFNEGVLDSLVQTIEKAEAEFSGLVIGHDGKHFSAGLDLHVITDSADRHNWRRVESILKSGQQAMLRVKHARIPVITAICGYALGGACELVMNTAAAQAHGGTRLGLVEADIGVIPAWGGTKEHLFRAAQHYGDDAGGIVRQCLAAFRQIAVAQKSLDAEDAFTMRLLEAPSRITMNRERLLPDAKSLCLALARDYAMRRADVIEVPSAIIYQQLMEEAMKMTHKEQPGMTQHRHRVLEALAATLSGHRAAQYAPQADRDGGRSGWVRLTEQQILHSTHDAFMELAQTQESLGLIRRLLHQ